MPERKLTTQQDGPRQIISDDDDKVYQYEVSGADIRLGPNPRSMNSHGVRYREGDDGTISASGPLYAEVHPDNTGPAVINMVAGVEGTRNPRRKVERPSDAAVRTANSEIVNKTGTVGSTAGASTTKTIADNTGSGVYRLQIVNLAETSGNYSENINLKLQIKDDTGAVKETLEANLGQLPFVFGTPVRVPASFSVDATVVNYSGVGIDFRVSTAYTKEGI